MSGLVSLVVGEGMRIAALGTGMGVMAGWAALRILQSQFDGVAVGDVRGAVVAVAQSNVTRLERRDVC